MPLAHYGVLVGRVVDIRREDEASSPHFQVRVKAGNADYRIAVNVKSQVSPSELLFLVVEDFRHVVTDRLRPLADGFTSVAKQPGGLALDFIRANLFDRLEMRPLPPNLPGPDNDLSDRLAHYIGRARVEADARIFAFGDRWGPETGTADKIFGFKPGNGIHDIHMNQGNAGRFVEQDGVWQDGGLIIHFPPLREPDGTVRFPEQWVGIFLAFQSQAWHTDDQTGHAIGAPEEADGHLRIVAALVNPQGEDPGLERVTIVNTTPASIDLEGWAIADKNKRKSVLGGPVLEPGAAHVIVLPGDGAQLSNEGGIITLLDPHGLKVHGVSYTREGASRQGWTVVF
jgi:uncharacterized protein YukJ